MKIISILALSLVVASCATPPKQTASTQTPESEYGRNPAAASGDLTGDYLGEALYTEREDGMKRPAMRLYLDKAQGEADTYYGVLFEYTNLLAMSVPYASAEYAPPLNKVFGYLNEIGTHIEAFKATPGPRAGTYNLYNLAAQNGRIVAAANPSMVLTLGKEGTLKGASITGKKDGQIVFPGDQEKPKGFSKVTEFLNVTQYELAKFIYAKGHLKSTWRGNWNDLEGTYLSEYGLLKDGVHELYTENGHRKVKFVKTNRTKAKNFTNPKSATLVGEYYVSEPIPKMYVLTPATTRKATASDVEMRSRIGLFLDVFDGSAPEAGGHLVTELAYTNPNDPEDYMMYYEHPQHVKNVGVEPPKKPLFGK